MKKNIMHIAKDLTYSLDTRETQRNNNVLVVGASGTGKTRSIVTPNLLEATGSYIVADPKGNLYNKYGDYLRRQGYAVRCLDFTNPERSCGYNLFRYIRTENDILNIAHMLIYSNKYEEQSRDAFWLKSAELLLSSLIAYVWEFTTPENHTLSSVLHLLGAMRAHGEGNQGNKETIDYVFDEIEAADPDNFAVKMFRQYRTIYGAERTEACIIMEVSAKIGLYQTEALTRMMENDETDISSIGREKTALFVVVSDTERYLDGLVNIFYTQAMRELCRVADQSPDYRLAVPVRFILDDFATNCVIADFPRMISSIRSREISVMLMIQAESQLEAFYGVDAGTIIMNCDTYVYLGGADIATARAVADRADVTLQHVLLMPVGQCYVFRRGEEPVTGELINARPKSRNKEQKRQLGFAI